jgi:Predicted ATPase
MTVQDIISQTTLLENGKIKSNSTNKEYEIYDFIEQVSDKLKLSAKEKRKLESHFSSFIKPQTQESEYVESIINKYNFKSTDGVYLINNEIMSLDNIYKLFWKKERLLPTTTDALIENIEKISESENLQKDIYYKIIKKYSKPYTGKSKYLESLDIIYPDIPWRNILYNILIPETKPLFHIFYDDGVGGTGKSTFLEVITKIVGESFVSNVLLDQFGNRFIFSNMLGKYVNIGDDNGKNEELQNIGTLKSIITGNRVTIDRKNISPIEVRIFAKQLYATNLFPYIDFTDGGIMRRLNIIQMNKVIPKNMYLCELDEEELNCILNEVLNSKDLEKNNNELAITTSPLYRFYNDTREKTYQAYNEFCLKNGFRTMNIINFETKSKFIKHFIKNKIYEEAIEESLPF